MCYIYRQRGGKNTRPRCVDRGGNPSRVAAATLVGPGKERRTILCGLGCTYVEDNPTPCTGLNLIQHNTFNTSPAVTAQPLQMLKLDRDTLNTEERMLFVKMSVNCDVIGTWSTRT
jgi:hypothetical protein